MYEGVPIAVPVAVSDDVSALYARAMPKSAILTVPPRVTQHVLRLEVAMRDPVRLGVREARKHPFERRRTPGAGRARPTSRRSEPPLTYSIAMYGDAVVLEEVVERDDVRVVQAGGELRLAHEPLREQSGRCARGAGA